MVAGKQQQHASTTSNNNNNSAYEIRSGMSVQDLKQLTAQRAHRQRMEYWDLHASTSTSTRNSSPRPTASGAWAFGSPGSSTSSSSTSSSLSDSPPRQYSKNNMYAYPNSYANHSHNNSSSYYHHHHHHNSYHSHLRGSPSTLSSSGNGDKMFVTCGGQVVSFMEGVVNAPQFEFLPEML